jgi:hypothetical protein
LLTDTGHWGMLGVDLGANTEHSDGRLYFFFGDTAEKPHVGVPRNADLVAWTEDREILRHGGHQWQGFTFFLPSGEQQHASEPKTGQGDWRFCVNCHGLFFDGFPGKGVCPGALGGGIRLHAVLGTDGNLDPFRAAEPLGVTRSLETPQGAFSFGGTAYVFAGIAPRRFSFKKRPVNPTYGNYLFSKARPDVAGEFHTEFLFNPRIGWCPTDSSRTVFESHRVLGLRFVIQTGGKPGPGWRAWHKCDSMFWDAADVPSVCHKGGRHEAKATTFVFPTVGVNDGQHQDHWFRCRNCASLFFNGFDGNKGLCPAGGEHVADELTVSVAHATFDEDIDMMDT